MSIERYYYPLLAHRVTQETDAMGDTVSTVGEGVEFFGYIGKPSSGAAVRMAQKGVDVAGRLYAPTDAPLSELCVVSEPDTGAAFQVVSEPRDAGRRGHHVEADLTEWRGGVKSADN